MSNENGGENNGMDTSTSTTPAVVVVDNESNKSATTPPVSGGNGVSIEDLYRYFGVLADANDQAGQHVEAYLQIIAGTKSGNKEKTLASQFITRFFKHFAKEMPIAIDAVFDLCEDDDVNIRKAAIKDLALISKDCPVELLNRIGDILTQLLQTEDQSEFAQVQASLMTVFKHNPKSILEVIFTQISTAELEEVRKRAIQFLVAKIPTLFTPNLSVGATFNKDFEDLVVQHVKQVLVDVDAEEFVLFVKLLAALPTMNTIAGKMDLVDIIMTQAELEKPFDATDMERIMILLSCIQQAIPFFSKSCPSTKYVTFYIRNVLVIMHQLEDDNLKFEILKSLAELSLSYLALGASGTNQENKCTTNELDVLFNRLVEYLPKPEFTETTTTETKNGGEDQKFNFSYVECLLFAFHAIGRYHEAYLTAAEETTKERARDFRLRLQYFAKGTQNYIKELRNSLLSASAIANQENEENKVRRVALKVTTNIDILIKDFFQNPPSYKSSIVLSWKSNEMKQLSTEPKQPQSNKATIPTGPKASTNINTEAGLSAKKRALSTDSTEGGQTLKRKPERGIYQPPSGKYSSNVTGNGNGYGNGAGNKRRTASSGVAGSTTGANRNGGRRF